ncbi:MAG: isoaspartyl peptidase/L-asparaginase [Flavobacteriales bacterium]|nr:isoaspartyl peptidase/L-asparaginase [Flavobacteriales bacterium]
MHNTVLAVHGGAGTLIRSQMSPEKEKAYTDALRDSLKAGQALLSKGGSAMDVVESAVKSMEDSPLFNAGKGSVFTADGTHEMDASIMNGIDLSAGAVCGVSGVKNPISLARKVMEKTDHVMLAGKGAEDFAKSIGVKMMHESYFHDDFRFRQWQSVKGSDEVALDHNINIDKKFGTVGAVALDVHGNIAAATSTGGMTNKKYGRVGDSPIIGSGTYANNNTCAVSCTGSGEFFIKGVVAYEVSAIMEFKGLSLKEACDEVIHDRLLKINGDGGLIAVDSKGNYALPFNTEGMYRGVIDSLGQMTIQIYGD